MTDRSILIVASNFPPVHSAGVYRTLRLAKYLPEQDWSVHVLTLDVNTLPDGAKTDVKLLEQAGRDICIHRSRARFPLESINRWTGRARRSSGAGKTSVDRATAGRDANLERPKKTAGIYQAVKDRLTVPLMTPDRLVGWVRPASALGIAVARQNAFDLVYSSGPPWSNHLVAQRVVAKTGLPWIADFRDPWVGNAFRPGRNDETWAGRKHRSLEAAVCEDAQVVIFNTQRALEDAVDRMGATLGNKAVVIPNGFDPEHFSSLAGPEYGPRSEPGLPVRMLHAGSFYGRRNVDSLLKAIGRLKRDREIDESRFQLELIGAARPREENLVKEFEIGDIVTLLPSLPHRDCLQRLCTADALLLVQTDAPLCVPGKLYEYIAIGKPIFTIASDGATADLVDKEQLGHCVAPTDTPRLESALVELIQQHRVQSMTPYGDAVRERYDGRAQMAVFQAAFEQAILSKQTKFESREPIL